MQDDGDALIGCAFWVVAVFVLAFVASCGWRAAASW